MSKHTPTSGLNKWPEHTADYTDVDWPTPWEVDGRAIHISTDRAQVVTTVDAWRDADPEVMHAATYEDCENLATHIVRCVNHHDELVAALHALVESQTGPVPYNLQNQALDHARAILDKVKS